MSLEWGLYQNLEHSTVYFLSTEISNDSITDYDGTAIPVLNAGKVNDNYDVPRITVGYEQENDLGQLYLGNSKRDDRHLLIIDIFAIDKSQRLALAKWIRDKLLDGWRYYSYITNPADRDTPTKTASGLINIDQILTNEKVDVGENMAQVEAHRHRISLTVWIQE